jgi:hypothetical protein
MARVRSAAPWVVVTAGVAAVVCLVGWPRHTLCVAGLITAVVALLVGLRMLFAEHGQTGRPPCAGCAGCGGPDCAERPDASGSDPETARTDPDAPGQQPAEQPGHDPDDLRTRLLSAMSTAVTIPGGVPNDDEQVVLDDLATAVLGVVQPELADYRHRLDWHTTCGICARTLGACYAETRRAETAEAELAAMRSQLTEALHTRPEIGWPELIEMALRRWEQLEARTAERERAEMHAYDAEATITRVRELAEPALLYDDVPQDRLARSILNALAPPAVVPCPTGCAVPTGVHHRHIKPADQPDH